MRAAPAGSATCTGPLGPRPVREVRFRAPAGVALLFWTVLEAAQRLEPGEAQAGLDHRQKTSASVLRIARHFLQTWPLPEPGELTLAEQVVLRDRGRCTAPGCTSRLALQSHHIWFRGQRGPDVPWNQTCLCLTHHIEGVHQGRVLIWGRASEELEWVLGPRPGGPPVLWAHGDVLMRRAGAA